MGEITPQDGRAAALGHATNTYTALKDTAMAFVHAQSYNAALPSRMDVDALRALAAPSFTHAFGPAYAVAQAPKLQGQFTMEAFIAHLGGMVPHLETWEIEVRGCVVDEVGCSVVVRASYWMQVQGERVENDVVWWLEVEEGLGGSETGGGEAEGRRWRVSKSTEIVDAGAAGRIKELMMGGKEGGGRKDAAAVAE